MIGRSEQSFEQIGQRRAHYRYEPGSAASHLPAREVAEPDSRAEIRCQMRSIQVERQSRPRTPPLPRLHARGIELSEIEGVEADEPV